MWLDIVATLSQSGDPAFGKLLAAFVVTLINAGGQYQESLGESRVIVGWPPFSPVCHRMLFTIAAERASVTAAVENACLKLKHKAEAARVDVRAESTNS